MVGYDVYSPHYAFHGKLTGYRLTVIGAVIAYILYRLALLAFNVAILPLPLEGLVLVVCNFGLYFLGSYQHVIPPYRPGFFHDDHVQRATPYLRTVALFYLAFLCFLTPVFSIIFSALVAVEVTEFVMKYISSSGLAILLALILVTTFSVWLCVTAYTYLSQTIFIRDIVSGFFAFTNDRYTFPATSLHTMFDCLSTMAGIGLAAAWLIISVVPWWTKLMRRGLTPAEPIQL